MTMIKMTAKKAIAILLAGAIATPSFAQVPDFGYRVKLEGVDALPASAGATDPVPPTQPANDQQPDFDIPTPVPYGIAAIVGEPVSLTMATRNGAPPVTWQPGPALDGGLTFADGTISGTASAPASQVATFQAVDGQGRAATANVTIQIVNAAVSLRQFEPIVRVGAPFQMRVNSNVRGAEYVLTGAPGMTRGPTAADSSVEIAGTATTPGTFPVEVQVGRAGTAISATASGTVEVLAPLALAFQPSTIPASIGAVVNATAVASGAGASPAIEVLSGLPDMQARGLSLSGPTLSGTLTAGPAATLSVRVTDPRDGKTAVASITAPAVESVAFTVASNHSNQTHRPGQARTYTVTSSLPGATFELVGAPSYVTISGSTVTTVGPDVSGEEQIPAYSIRATDPENASRTKDLEIASPGTLLPAIAITAQAVTGRGQVALTAPFSFTGATAPQAPELAGGSVPPGMTLGASAITGKPTTPGTYNPQIRIRDARDNHAAVATLTITVTASLDFAITSARNPVGKGTIGSPMLITATPANNDGAVTFENVPISGRTTLLSSVGLTLSPSGEITGTPAAASSGIANIRMTEASTGTTIDKPLQLAIGAVASPSAVAPRVYSPTDPDLFAALYDADGTTSSGPLSAGTKLTYEFDEDVTIDGILANTNLTVTVRNKDTGTTHTISGGTAGANRTFTSGGAATTGRNFEVSFSSSYNAAYARLTSGGAALIAPSITVASSTTTHFGNAVNATVATAANATAPVTWTVLGALPAGLTVDESTGTISGSTNQYGDYPLTIRVTDARGLSSVWKNGTLKVRSADTVGSFHPQLTGFATQEENLLALGAYTDNQSTTNFQIPAGATVTLTFDRPVTATNFQNESSGSVTVTAVDTGYATTASGPSPAAGHLFAEATTSQVWTIRNNETAKNWSTIRLRYGYDYKAAPQYTQMTASQDFIVNASVGSALTPAGANAGPSGAQGWSYTGEIPAGLNFNPATGALTGSPTTIQTVKFRIFLTNNEGVRSFSREYTVRVLPAETAANVMPEVSGIGPSAELRSKLMDRATTSESTVPFNPGDTITFTYPTAVRVDGFFWNSGSYVPLLIRNETTNEVVYNGNASGVTQSVTLSGGSTFTVRHNGTTSTTVSNMALTFGGSRQYIPTIFSAPAAGTAHMTGSAVSIPLTANDVLPAGSASWSFSGTLPGSVSFNPSTGAFSGTADGSAGISGTITLSDGRGYSTQPKPIDVAFVPSETAQNTRPVISGVGDPTTTTNALLDASTATTVSVSAGTTLTFTYPSPVSLNWLHYESSTGSNVTVRNLSTGEVILSSSFSTTQGRPMTGGLNVQAPNAQSNVHVGTAFEVTIASTTTLRRLTFSYGSSTPTF